MGLLGRSDMELKTRYRTLGFSLVIAGTLSFLAALRLPKVPSWLQLLPGAAFVVLLIGCLLLIRWYFRLESDIPKWTRTLWSIVGVMLLILSFFNVATFGGLGAAIFGY